jgi:hypothetical protein
MAGVVTDATGVVATGGIALGGRGAAAGVAFLAGALAGVANSRFVAVLEAAEVLPGCVVLAALGALAGAGNSRFVVVLEVAGALPDGGGMLALLGGGLLTAGEAPAL